MRIQALLILVGWAVFSCAGSQSATTEPEAAPAADAPSFAVHGLEVHRPADWEFIAPDASVVSDTVMIMHGPVGDHEMRPAVEVSRRQLSAADRKRKPASILTNVLVREITQTFEGFDADGQPEDMQISGLPAAMLRMKVTEMLPDGASVDRQARFYLVVQESQMWVVRCFGPADGSAGEAFDAIVGSIEISD